MTSVIRARWRFLGTEWQRFWRQMILKTVSIIFVAPLGLPLYRFCLRARRARHYHKWDTQRISMAVCGHTGNHWDITSCCRWRARDMQNSCIGWSRNLYSAKYNTPYWPAVRAFVLYWNRRTEITYRVFNNNLLHNVLYLLIIAPIYFGLSYWPYSGSSLGFLCS